MMPSFGLLTFGADILIEWVWKCKSFVDGVDCLRVEFVNIDLMMD